MKCETSSIHSNTIYHCCNTYIFKYTTSVQQVSEVPGRSKMLVARILCESF